MSMTCFLYYISDFIQISVQLCKHLDKLVIGDFFLLWAPRFEIWAPPKKPIIFDKKSCMSLKKGSDLIKIRRKIQYYINVTQLYLTILPNLSWHTGQLMLLATIFCKRKHLVSENINIRTDPEQKAKTA